MRLVLCPGHIYLHQKLIVKKRLRGQEILPDRFSFESKSANSGPDVLATCRQLYQEWHAFYYSSNVFHIPTSSIMIMKPNHRALIRHVGLRLSLLDVIPSKTEEIEALAKRIEERALLKKRIEERAAPFMPLEQELYSRCCAAILLGVWLSNISSIRESFPGLKTICLEITTRREPQRLLRVGIPAKIFNSWIGYRFEFFNDNVDPEYVPELASLEREYYEKYRLDMNTGVFLDFAAKHACWKVYYDMLRVTGTWANFKESVDDDLMRKDWGRILVGEWWKERINPITETVEVV
ncbi:MAG: hypothetical protein Q9195_004746 [Heterodermia aff. obscurata]